MEKGGWQQNVTLADVLELLTKLFHMCENK